MACATANALSGVVFIGRPLAGRAAARSYVDRSTAQNRDDHSGPSELRMAISYEFWRAVSGPERETVIGALWSFRGAKAKGSYPPTAAVADAARTRKDPVGKQVISDRRAMRGFGARFEAQNM